MKATRADVYALAVSLMAVFSSMRRATGKGDAATLALLNIVAIHPKVRPSDIAIELGVNQSSITRQLQKFQQRGMVRLAADPNDGRSCHIELTAAGRNEVKRLRDIGLSRFALFVKDWDARDVQTFTRLLSRFEISKAAVGPHNGPRPTWRNGAKQKARDRS
jgi:DNA-binding MarR family transcriptional regulator